MEALVARLEARGRHPQFSQMLHDYLDVMDIAKAGSVLDIGCGSGLAARTIANLAGFSGIVTGVDLSPYLIATATRLAREEGVAERTEFRTGDVHRLDFASGSFDAVIAHTLLSHVEDPLAVVKEAARVLRSGGLLGIFDGDYASLTFDHEDPGRGKAYEEAVIGAIVTNPRIMRQLPRLLQKAGVELVVCFPYVLSEVGEADFWSSAFEMFHRLLPSVGAMTEDEVNAWVAALRHDSEAGVFFGSSNFYAYVARRH
jgi:ubiquinone/menaquinone biosynthesis C-methylase UbiE